MSPFLSGLSRREFLQGASALAASTAFAQHSPASPADAGAMQATYLASFRDEELAATGTRGPDISTWFTENVPSFQCPDPLLERLYYFRWYSFHKHINETPKHGRLLTEFLIPVKWGGYGQTVGDAVPHHLRDARWLRKDSVAVDYARFWTTPDATPRDFSLALASAVRDVSIARGDTALLASLAPALAENFHTWEATRKDPNGLFWNIDTRDGMEVSISGDGYRPTLNTYIFGDAQALSAAFRLAGDQAESKRFADKAEAQRRLIEEQLWNPRDSFYEVRSSAPDSPLRKEKKFKDNGTALQIANVRELIGYIPWYYNLPQDASRTVAWKQLFDPQGFLGKFGPTTAERRSPRFRYPTDDKCPWNGPCWNYSTTQTLVALGNALNGPAQNNVSKADYLRLMRVYAFGQRLKLENGQTVTWTDEAQDPDTGQWISRDWLKVHDQPLYGRGSYYNHSGFADPLITGLVGLRPREDAVLEINPLLPAGEWAYFAMDGLPYHGRLLRVQWDADGSHFKRGAGLRVWADGKLVAQQARLGHLQGTLV